MKKYGLIRTNHVFRDQFIDVCKKHYMTMSDVIRAYIYMCVERNAIVYCDSVSPYPKGSTELDGGLAFWIDSDVYSRFGQLAKPSVSAVIRGYMLYCIQHDIPHTCLNSIDGRSDAPVDILRNQLSTVHEAKVAAAIGDTATVMLCIDVLETSIRTALSASEQSASAG